MVTVAAWTPASPFEETLLSAYEAGDTAQCLTLLRGATLALPISEAAADGREPPTWMTVPSEERTWVLAYTSVEGMDIGTGGAGTHARLSSLPELAAGWPAHAWGLAINAGLPMNFFFESGTLARLAAPSLREDSAADPAAHSPLMQKLLTSAEVYDMLGAGKARISGYVHQLADVAHIATPTVLVDCLGRTAETEFVMTAGGGVNLLRWPAVGLDLYRSPYGGTDEAARDAVFGWLIEDPPFNGLGFSPNPSQLIREYKVDGILAPHGAELWELDEEGAEHRFALFDGDRESWVLVTQVPADIEEDDDTDDPWYAGSDYGRQGPL